MPSPRKKQQASDIPVFPGQHLIVLPDSVRRKMQSHPLLQGLLITDAGIFPRAAKHKITRPNGTSTTLLFFCTAGRGWIQINGSSTQPVTPGTLAWLPANQPHIYASDETDPWTIEWVHLSGSELPAWAELLQVPPNGGTLSFNPADVAQIGLGDAWPHLERGYSLTNLVAASATLRNALSALARQHNSPAKPGTSSAMERIGNSTAWMKTHFAQQVRLDELAARAALSVPHYSALFRQYTGFAPIDWLIRLRIQRACQLLDTTPHSIAAIAEQVGFNDPYYFTRSFRRIMSTSPRAYRNEKKG